MSGKLVFILIALLYCMMPVMSQDNGKDNTLRAIIESRGQAEVTIPFPGSITMRDLARIVSVTSVKDNTVKIILSPLTVGWFLDQKFSYSIIRRPLQKALSVVSYENLLSD
ncbi:MAG TPA: hypothetical protein VJ963_06860, partial [Bacteroidales bacterium]|nr:hypothetical protein [Bacteroidales bacterium]